MMKDITIRRMSKIPPVVLLLFLHASTAAAQKYEAALQISGMHLHKIDQAPVNLGGEFSYRFTPMVSGGIEVSLAAGPAGDTLGSAGIRLRKQARRAGIFVDGRAGVIHFTGDLFKARMDVRTHSIVEVGGGFEYYPTAHLTVRVGADDAVIYYGSARFSDRPNPDALGTVHNFQPAVGIGLRF